MPDKNKAQIIADIIYEMADELSSNSVHVAGLGTSCEVNHFKKANEYKKTLVDLLSENHE